MEKYNTVDQIWIQRHPRIIAATNALREAEETWDEDFAAYAQRIRAAEEALTKAYTDANAALVMSVQVADALAKGLLSPSEAESVRHGTWTSDRLREVLSARQTKGCA